MNTTSTASSAKKPTAPIPPYNHPENASSQIDWNTIPMYFTELGPNSVNSDQPAVLKHQLETVKWAQTTGKAKDPAFDGAMVFSHSTRSHTNKIRTPPSNTGASKRSRRATIKRSMTPGASMYSSPSRRGTR